ncbi:MAG: hypothetical protein JNL58_03635 [Planctomyces sp.]|nr:hypothetical protein [Planctomyces sp.]
MTTDRTSNAALLTAFVIMSVAVAGYFTGLQAPMNSNSVDSERSPANQLTESEEPPEVGVVPATDNGVIPATDYSEMVRMTAARRTPDDLASLKSSIDPLAEIRIRPEDKLMALQQRSQNRAFNGAPPTVPHPIDQQSDVSCIACHRNGAVTSSLLIPKMSHTMMANCTQCHVESEPRHLPSVVFRENLFTGLPAPTGGPRAFPGAPPQMPHTTWMRSDCMSCHGYSGRHGIRTTHPWRSNCLQCHTPSATLEQTLQHTEPQFLPGPEISNNQNNGP